jgi:hypothetical protein
VRRGLFGAAPKLHQRIDAGTLPIVPVRSDRIVPNVEHMLRRAWTPVTALVSVVAVYG